jgi:hypothetical protein
MANFNFENTKKRNGFTIGMEMEDLKIGDIILFEGESDNAQGHAITDIFRIMKGSPVIIQHMPEFTPVCNESMFVYGKVKFRKKYPK